MVKVLDKFVPLSCGLLAILLLATAFYLNAETAWENLSTKARAGETDGRPKILIVPGHDLEYVGAKTAEITEAELNLKVGTYLKEFLEKDGGFEVYMTREIAREGDEVGDDVTQKNNDYTETFQNFFETKREDILNYRNFYKAKTAAEDFDASHFNNQVEHNKSPEKVSYKLYAINKWVEDNDVDVVLHLHFNDYAGRKKSPGKYSGFSIYTPGENWRNGAGSLKLADSVASTLKTFLKFSNAPVEKDGIISGTELIATGAGNMIPAASILIEYGYIYEKQFTDEENLKKAAEQTYLGLKDYFSKK